MSQGTFCHWKYPQFCPWSSLNVEEYQSPLSCHFFPRLSTITRHDLIVSGDEEDLTTMLNVSMGDRIPSTTPGAEPPRDARDSGSARSHSMHLETSSSDQP